MLGSCCEAKCDGSVEWLEVHYVAKESNQVERLAFNLWFAQTCELETRRKLFFDSTLKWLQRKFCFIKKKLRSRAVLHHRC